MDKKILNLVQAKPKSVSLIDPNKKVNRGYVLRFNYGSEVVDGKRKQIRKDAYLKIDFNHFPKNAFDRAGASFIPSPIIIVLSSLLIYSHSLVIAHFARAYPSLVGSNSPVNN